MAAKAPHESKLVRLVFGVVTSLLASGVVGLWHMSNSMSALEERVAIWTKVGNDRIDYATSRLDGVAKDQRDLDLRVGLIEGAVRPKKAAENN